MKMNDNNKVIMTKCNFCPKSSPEGKCYWDLPAHRDSDCRKAIETMMKAFKNSQSNSINNKEEY